MVVTFEQFASMRLARLLRMCTAICRDPVLAEDLVQEVLIKVQVRWAQISRLDIPEAYVRRMLVNEYLSARRRSAGTVAQADVGAVGNAPDHADVHAEREALRSEIAQLPPRQQVVLALRYYEGLSDAEIAGVLGCRAGTVRGYASRALHSLRVQLTEPVPTQTRGRPR